VSRACNSVERNRKCVQNFSGETSWSAVSLKTQKRKEDDIKVLLKELGCEVRRWMGLAVDRDQWLALLCSWIH
jgi:hypothetical protein